MPYATWLIHIRSDVTHMWHISFFFACDVPLGIQCDWVTWRIHMCDMTCSYVTRHMQKNETCHIWVTSLLVWMSHVAYGMRHITCHVLMRYCHIWMSHVSYEWAMSNIDGSCLIWMCHVTLRLPACEKSSTKTFIWLLVLTCFRIPCYICVTNSILI